LKADEKTPLETYDKMMKRVDQALDTSLDDEIEQHEYKDWLRRV
jgi:hypothetical protein